MFKNEISSSLLKDLLRATTVQDKLEKYKIITNFLKKNICLNAEDENILIRCLNRDVTEQDDTLKCTVIDICDFLIKTDKTVIKNFDINNFISQSSNLEMGSAEETNILETILTSCLLDEDISTIPKLDSYDAVCINNKFKID